VPINKSGGLKANYILAFSERQLLAISCRQRVPQITTGFGCKAVVITGKADVKCQSQ
jgi:hypothetical protein